MFVPLNPIKAAVAGFAFGAGVSMIVFGALKGAMDIITESAEQAAKRAEEASQQPATEPVDGSADDYVI